MREIKFSYIAQHEDTGVFMEQIFTIEQIEGSNFVNQWQEKFPRFGKWIARRQFTGLLDKNGVEVFEGDIVKGILKGIGIRNIEVKQNITQGWYPLQGEDFSSFRDDFEVIGNIYSRIL